MNNLILEVIQPIQHNLQPFLQKIVLSLIYDNVYGSLTGPSISIS